MLQMLELLEQAVEEFEKAEEKNKFIQATDTEWLGFVDKSVTDKEAVNSILEENPFLLDYDIIVFGDEIPEGECDFLHLIQHPQCVIYAICFRRELLVRAGSYNCLIKGMVHFEFLLRLALSGKVYAIPCTADKQGNLDANTMAYIMRRYMRSLKLHGMLDEVFIHFLQSAEVAGVAAEFHVALNCFLENNGEYERIAKDTAPCLILVGSNMYYGVLAGFANSLADALVGLGQAVITTNGRYGGYDELSTEELQMQVYKAVIGFQAPALETDFFQKLKGGRYQFWFDNPIFSADFLGKASKHTHMLCQDAFYAKFMREYHHIENAIQFPPAGEEMEIHAEEKIYDIVFVGTYGEEFETAYEDAFQNEFFQYMREHFNSTFEDGLKAIWTKQGKSYTEQEVVQQLSELRSVCFDIFNFYRHKVVETILQAGIPLHVFGDSWKKYVGEAADLLIIHPEVAAEEALHIWVRSKIGLNIMRGHKAGMTERIANIMLCGACCLSDETVYLKEHFRDGEDIVLFRGDALEELPRRIKCLLHNEEERTRIARAGQEKARREHTWRKRAEELLELIDRNGG